MERQKYLANVEVTTFGINLGVECHEGGSVESVTGRDFVAVVVGLHNVGDKAVMAGGSEAQDLAGHEVGAARIDVRVVHSKLVTR